MRQLAVTLLLLAGAAAPALAAPPCGPDSTLLLHVDFTGQTLFPHPGGVRSTTFSTIYVCRDGLTVGATTHQNSVFYFQATSSIFRVRQPEALRTLARALGRSSIGTRTSCSFTPAPPPPNQVLQWQHVTVRWYGRGERANEFSYAFAVHDLYPPCSPEALDLLAALRSYADTAASAPTGEFYPPRPAPP